MAEQTNEQKPVVRMSTVCGENKIKMLPNKLSDVFATHVRQADDDDLLRAQQTFDDHQGSMKQKTSVNLVATLIMPKL